MRITFVVATADLTGGCRVVGIYARRLIERGHDVLVVTRKPYRGSWRERVRSALRGDPTHLLPRRHVSHLELLDVPRRYVDRHRPILARDVPDADAIVATWWETAEWIDAMPRRKGARAYLIQGNEADLVEDARRERVLRTWDLPFTRVVISSWLGRLVEERTGEAPILVPNSVDGAQFDAPPRGKQPRPTLGLTFSPTPIKGFDVATEVVRRVRAEIPTLRVVCFSAAKPPRDVQHWMEHHHRPAQDVIPKLYASCDVFLSTSRQEGFGLPALEAMACRTPLVSTRYGGPADFVRDGENGFLAEVDDVEALTARVLEVLRLSDASWRALSERTHASAHGYTWEDAAARLEAALELASS
ncbi:MAG: glycosyltransferase family 4 protein [Myxococcales bacterium]|nr:glycosyltransferase family 4 protein [Myxococcales bacterium]